MSVVRVEGLSKEFVSHGATTVAVDNLDLTLERGEFVCLLGPSGCGKTTTLRAIAGLEAPTGGTIDIAGQIVYSSEAGTYVPPERRGLGMVFQSYAVWPHMTVADNVGFPLRHGIGKRDKARHGEIDDRVARILELMDCAHLARRYPSELSGGQQQRVALARTLVYEPDLLLFDEPLSNLDAKLRERMRLELRELQQRLGFAALYVTHDREEALSLSDRILVMRDGVVIQAGTPEEIYEQPTDVFVADFIGPVNLLPISELRRSSGGVVAVTGIGEVMCADSSLPQLGAVGSAGETSVLVRPGSLVVDTHGEPGANCWEARVEGMTYLGDQVIYALRVGRVRLIATAPTRGRTQGERVFVTAQPDVCRVVAGRLPADRSASVDEAATFAVPA
ncbi:ABC transporter ATP-binding protein [Jiangella asiatica]|uniref:ABC transporter ATP-binding protein n=1 Tax=Jiangella asiatica TaxID=2530372 RepID=A0A4R5D9A3_9ACTN|nr:ABC transporter ATP-binding protein [Jiangella asiatica]TDE10172.1 ABC transporter ATP-binding protein [Jiangella asiatica]